MPIPTEPVGSIPRSTELIAGMQQFAAGRLSREQLARLQDDGVRDTIKRFEATESPVISDGEQSKPSFATYPIHGLASLAPDGVTIPFADGHARRLPRLTAGPFRYRTYAVSYLEAAKQHSGVPVKQAVISASALSLLYPQDGIPGYSRDAFLDDLVREAEPVRAQGRELLHPARERAGPRPSTPDHQAAREARPENLRRCDRPDQSENRDAGRGARSRPGSCGSHPALAAGYDRRLRIRAV